MSPRRTAPPCVVPRNRLFNRAAPRHSSHSFRIAWDSALDLLKSVLKGSKIFQMNQIVVYLKRMTGMMHQTDDTLIEEN